MLRATWFAGLIVSGLFLISGSSAIGQDWPQWRGANRDAKASGFKSPATWPKELTKKWSVDVGNGVSSPAIVGDKVYVFAREGEEEVVRGLNAANGEELWKDHYSASRPRGGAAGFPGPRSSPTVADGKVVTLGVDGVLSCYDAISGRMLWRNDEFDGDVPMFYTSSSPIVVDGLCIAQLGGRDEGGVIAFDLASGVEKWRWLGDSPAYCSPILMNVGGMNLIVAPGERKLVALGTKDGEVKWEIPYAQGGQYNSATPIVSGDTLILAGPGSGISAIKLSMQDGEVKEERVWSNRENSVQFNTPVLKDGLLFGLSNGGQLFCINTKEPEATAWTAPISKPAAEVEGAAGRQDRAAGTDGAGLPVRFAQFVQQQEEEQPRRGDGQDRGEGFRRGEDRGRGEGFQRGEGRGGFGRGFGGRGFGRGRGGRGGGGGYGSVVDAGSVLLALSPAAELVVFKPTDEAFTEVARYKVADGGTYAYPVPVGNGIYVKDQDALTLWTVE